MIPQDLGLTLIYPDTPGITLINRAGRRCSYIQGASLYFRVGDEEDDDTGSWRDATANQQWLVGLLYLDVGTDPLQIGYTSDGTTETVETIVTPTNTGKWLLASHTLAGTARAAHSLYADFGSADLRLTSDGELYLAAVLLYSTDNFGEVRWFADSNRTNISLGNLIAGVGKVIVDDSGLTLVAGTTILARLGNLNGVLDYSTYTPGLALGTLTANNPIPTTQQFMSYDATKGLRIAGTVTIGGGGNVNYGVVLASALMVCHFDGPRPYELDYTGNATGHRGQVATLSGGVIFRPGKFGKAVQLAEATTNLVTNPSFGTNTTGWTLTDANASVTFTRDTAQGLYGDPTAGTLCSAKLVNANANEDDFISCSVAISGNTAYTVSAWVYVPVFTAGATGNRGILYSDGTNAAATTLNAATSGWVRHVLSFTSAVGATSLQVRLYAPQGTAYWDGVQIEQKAYATPYCDGSLGLGHSWSGTAHASSSSRTAANLTYPTNGNINPLVGTIGCWFNVSDTSGNRNLFRVQGSTAGFIGLRVNSSNALDGFWGTQSSPAIGGGSVTPNSWQHAVITFDGTTARFYLNGALVASGAASGFSGIPASMYVGQSSANSAYADGYIDDLFISESVLSATEVAAIYTSQAPVVASTNLFEFRLTAPGQGYVFGNANGLFGVDVNGHANFGLTTTALNANLWGSNQSETLATGAVLLGSNESTYANVLWDPTAKQLKFRGGTTIQAYIDTDGSFVAGGGKVKVNANGVFGADTNNHANFGLTVGALNANTWGSNQSETLSAGAVMLGSNESGYANLLWDPTAKQLQLRTGTTIGSWIATDGSLNFNVGTNPINGVNWMSGSTQLGLLSVADDGSGAGQFVLTTYGSSARVGTFQVTWRELQATAYVFEPSGLSVGNGSGYSVNVATGRNDNFAIGNSVSGSIIPSGYVVVAGVNAPGGNFSFSGFAATNVPDGFLLVVYNDTTNVMTFNDADTNSLAANRIHTFTGAAVATGGAAPRSLGYFIRNGAKNRWDLLGTRG